MSKIANANPEIKTSRNITGKTAIESEEFFINPVEIGTVDDLKQK